MKKMRVLHREFYMFIVFCDKSSWEICLPEEKEFLIFIVVYVWRCQEMSRTHRIKHTRFVNQKRLKVFHQNVWGLFHNIANYPLFYTLTKMHIYFFSVKRTSIIQHQHSFLKFQGTPSLTKIEMMAYHLLEGLIWKLMNWNVFGLK